MNFFTKPMKLLTAVVLRSRVNQVSESLLGTGAMDFIDVTSLEEMDSAFEAPSDDDGKAKKVEDLLKQLKGIYSQGMLPLPRIEGKDIGDTTTFDMAKASSAVQKIENELLLAARDLKSANSKFQSFAEIDGYLKENKLNFIDIRVGNFAKSSVDIASKLSEVTLGVFPLDSENTVILTLKRDQAKVNPMVDKLGWIESDNPSLQKSALEISHKWFSDKTAELEKDVDLKQEKTKSLVSENKQKMDTLFKTLMVQKLCAKIKDNFKSTKNTAVFSGWVPVDKASQVEASIRKASENQCIIEWTAADDVKGVPVPVELQSPKVLAPFTRIVKNYSTPEYGTINPLIFTTVAFMCMFGLMFADVGQGLILILIGLFGAQSYKKNPMKKEGLINNNLCHLLLFLGASSMFFGVLFGSYFGFSWLPPLWFSYHHVVMGDGGNGLINDIYDILGITIKFGFVVILIGLVLNWINLFRKKQWVPLFMDKYGILGGWIYVVGFWGASYFVKSGYKSFPPGNFFIIAVAIPAILMLGKGPLESILNKERMHLGIMDWLVDLLEVFSGYLSNTLSFMRVAGLGIAHVSLMNAFEMMADMTANPVLYILILALGNFLVLAVEGLSAGIQALRLNYYEFFTKFFTGKGVAYKPVHIED